MFNTFIHFVLEDVFLVQVEALCLILNCISGKDVALYVTDTLPMGEWDGWVHILGLTYHSLVCSSGPSWVLCVLSLIADIHLLINPLLTCRFVCLLLFFFVYLCFFVDFNIIIFMYFSILLHNYNPVFMVYLVTLLDITIMVVWHYNVVTPITRQCRDMQICQQSDSTVHSTMHKIP